VEGGGGELTIKVANATEKAYHGPNWLRIFHVTDKRIECVPGKHKNVFLLSRTLAMKVATSLSIQ